jgi:ATP-dependent DNA helicase Q4
VGRAGRDGTEAQCHTFIDDDEFLKLRSLTFSDGVDESDLMRVLKQIFLPDAAPGMCSAIVVQTAEAELGLRQEVRAAACSAPSARRSPGCFPQVIETVLSYLVLGEGLPDEAPLISTLPDMCATLHLAFHKSDPQELAATSALVEQLLKAAKERQGKHTVSIPLLAHRLRVPFMELQEQLRLLAEAGEVSYTSSDRALCLKVRFSVRAG